MAQTQITRKVTDYQLSLLQPPQILNPEHNPTLSKLAQTLSPSHSQRQSQKFSEWNLDKIYTEICVRDGEKYRIAYIGSQVDGVIDGYFYGILGLLVGNHGGKDKNGLFIKFKFGLYELAMGVLTVDEQTGLVEGLCNVRYAKNVGTFLKQNINLLRIFRKLAQNSINPQQANSPQSTPFQKIKKLSSYFDFLKHNEYMPNITQIKLRNTKIYILKYKQICFVFHKQQQYQQQQQFNYISVSECYEQINYNNNNNDNNNDNNEKNNIKRIIDQQRQDKCKEIKCTKRKLSDKNVPKFILDGVSRRERKGLNQIRYTHAENTILQRNLHQSKQNKKGDQNRSNKVPTVYKLPQFLDARSSLKSNPTQQLNKQEGKIQSTTRMSSYETNQNKKLNKSNVDHKRKRNSKSKSKSKSRSRSPHQISLQYLQNMPRKHNLKRIELSMKKLVLPTTNQYKNDIVQQKSWNSSSATKYGCVAVKDHSFLFSEKKKRINTFNVQ